MVDHDHIAYITIKISNKNNTEHKLIRQQHITHATIHCTVMIATQKIMNIEHSPRLETTLTQQNKRVYEISMCWILLKMRHSKPRPMVISGEKEDPFSKTSTDGGGDQKQQIT